MMKEYSVLLVHRGSREPFSMTFDDALSIIPGGNGANN